VYGSVSNPAVTAAWWTGSIFTLISLVCIGYMFFLRLRAGILRKRRDRVVSQWEGMLYEVTLGDEPMRLKRGQTPYKLTKADKKDVLRTYIEQGRFDPVEPLPDEDVPHFLFLWNYLHESLRGGSKDNLNELADNLDLEGKTLRMLRRGSLKEKIIAINTFGNMRDRNVYGEIERLSKTRDPIVSLWAWRALLRIDFDRTVAEHLDDLNARQDWSPTFIAKVLLESDKDLLAEPLVALVEKYWQEKLAERPMSRLISYLSIVHVSSYSPLVDRILREGDETEVLIACLRLVKWEGSLNRVRELLTSDRWEVRLQVVQTLGRFGFDEDIDLLIESLNDLDWWVRYRSASALLIMPTMTEARIEQLAKTLPNAFARDILSQVMAENRLLCLNRTSSSTLSK
jgi:hypothetical protein